jgi:hypothetical protein
LFFNNFLESLKKIKDEIVKLYILYANIDKVNKYNGIEEFGCGEIEKNKKIENNNEEKKKEDKEEDKKFIFSL